MAIYVIFLIYILLCGGVVYSTKGESKRKDIWFLNGVFIAMFLLYSLRASTVGRDLPGYELAYVSSNGVNFSTLSWGNFEKGYLFLMWICNRMNLSFQWYLTLCNFIILFPIYWFIRKYSENKLLSVLIYVGYMFFEFNLTGIRQAIATSIVLIGIMVLIESKKLGLLKYCLIVLLATFFHTGAFIGFFYIPFYFVKKSKYYFSATLVLCFTLLFTRGYIMSFVKDYFEKDSMHADAGLYIGLNLIFLIGLTIMFAFAGRNREIMDNSLLDDNAKKLSTSMAHLEKMFYLSIAALFLFGSDNSVRSYMLLNQVIIVLLPNSLEYAFDKKTKGLATAAFSVFFLMFFFTNTLLSGGFDIVPYRFFWQK